MLRFVRWASRRRPRARRCSRYLGALAAGVVALLATAPGADAATCRGRNFVDHLGLTLGVNQGVLAGAPIRVTDAAAHVFPDQEVNYNHIEDAFFTAQFDVRLCRPGALDGVELRLGSCTGHSPHFAPHCRDVPQMFFQAFSTTRDFRSQRNLSFRIPVDSEVGKTILSRCNALVDQARGAQQDIPAGSMTAFVTLGVDTRRDLGRVGGLVEGGQTQLNEYSKTKSFPFAFSIACAPLPVMSQAPPKITQAVLGVAASGKTCPKPATATVAIAAEKPRAVFYKIERPNGTTTTDDWIEGDIKMQKGPVAGSKGAFLHATHKLGRLDPGKHRFRLWIDTWGKTPWRTVKVGCPPFKVTSAWLKFDVEDKATCPRKVVERATFHANRPGKVRYEIKHQGGLAVSKGTAKARRKGGKYVATAVRKLTIGELDAQFMADVKKSPANSGWVPLKIDCLQAESGKVTLKGLGTTSCRGEALVAIHTSGAGNVPYELECGPGRSWQRSVTAPANKIGVDKVRFDVKNNERVTCALRTRLGGKLKPLDGASRTFRCHKPSGVGSADDLMSENGPVPAAPQPPDRVVDDPRPGPRIACAGGRVRAGRCRCPRGDKAVRVRRNAWRCVDRGPRISCAGGRVRAGRCRCPRGDKAVRVRRNAWRCVDRGPRITCAGGRVRAGRCRCPRRARAVRIGRRAWRCITRPRGCPPGRVRVRGRCIKPAR